MGAVDFAIGQVLRNDAPFTALPAVLARLLRACGGTAALALQPSARSSAVLAVHPTGASNPALLTEIRALSWSHRDAAAAGGCVQVPLESAAPATCVLLAYSDSEPAAGECLCAVALVAVAPDWDEQVRCAAHAVATTVAAQIQQANTTAELAEREALARALIAGSPDAIIAMDADRRLVAFNPAAEELTGHRRDDVMGKEMPDLLIPERDRARLVEHTKTFLRTGDRGEFVGRIRVPILRADGSERAVELTPVPLTIEGRTIFCGFLRDLTELERLLAAEQAARRSLADQTERLNCLIANAIPGALFTDEQGRITHMNHSFGAMLGIESAGQLVGTPVSDTVRRIKSVFADPGDFIRRTAEAFGARQPVAGEQIACADGRTLECDYWPVMVAGHYRGDLWLVWDMSERKALEKQRERMLEAELAARRAAELAQRRLAEQNDKLRELDDAKTQFLSTVSHELRTPLTSIVSFSELLNGERDALTPDGAHFLQIIERNAERLLRLVDDLLLLSRFDMGAMPLELAPVSVPELVAEAVRAASANAAAHGVTLHISVSGGPAVRADRLRLLQVLDNLTANAIKFTRAGGLVRVDAQCDGRMWRIDVADTGIGIPPGEIGQLFGRFVRASNARTAALPGTGLGLSVVKAITELHGGRVEVDSTLGRGTTFSIYLPVST